MVNVITLDVFGNKVEGFEFTWEIPGFAGRYQTIEAQYYISRQALYFYAVHTNLFQELIDKGILREGLHVKRKQMGEDERFEYYSGEFRVSVKHKDFVYELLLKSFSNKESDNIVRPTRDIIRSIVRKFNGFPSSSITTKKIEFIFEYLAYRAHTDWKKDFSEIKMALAINLLIGEKDAFYQVLLHELLHSAAEAEYGQHKLLPLIKELDKREEIQIKKNRSHVDSSIRHLYDFCQKNLETFHPWYIEEELKGEIKTFYHQAVKIFHNIVADTALGILAIELNDKVYSREANRMDESLINDLSAKFGYLNTYFDEHILPIAGNLKSYLVSTKALLQFILCYNYMPFHGIAWGVLSDSQEWASKHPYANLKEDNTSKNLIGEFKGLVTESCHSKVARYFLDFYDAYLDIAKIGALHNNPLNPGDIKREIHDAECLKQTSKAYMLLNKGFHHFIKNVGKKRI